MSEIKTETLRQLHPFNELSDAQLKKVIPLIKPVSLEIGDRLQAMDHLDSLVYLFEGRIGFFNNFSTEHVITAADESAKNSLFNHVTDPTNYYAEAIYGCELIAIEKNSLDNIIFDELFGTNSIDPARDIETSLYQQIEHAINTNSLILPSLPEIALRVKSAMKKESITAHDIETIIESDPVMALRIIQIANSPIVRGSTTTDNLRDAIVRIGMSKTHDIVISLAIKLLFKSDSPLLKKQMINLYVHSIEIAAISYAIAEKFSPINAEKLLLAGLLHDIGTIPIIAYIEKDLIDLNTEFKDEHELKNTIQKLRPAIGSMIISKWGISDKMIPVVEEAENWERNPNDKIDMCDIINTAHILSYYKKDQISLIPHIESTACFQKLFPGSTNISDCDEILEQANEKISEIKFLIHA